MDGGLMTFIESGLLATLGGGIGPLAAASQQAFSVRKLRSSYAGSALRVRRSNDNAESDIGFTAVNDLDQSALTTFTGANSGFVTTWYDQSGHGNHAVQATTTLQPRIVNAGVVHTKNSKPTVVFGATGRTYLIAPASITGTTLAGNAVFYDSAMTDNCRVMAVTDNTANNDYDNVIRAVVMYLSTDIKAYRNGPLSLKARTVNQLGVWTSVWDGSVHTIYLDQAAGSPVASTGTWGSTNLILGEQSPVGLLTNYMIGGISEVFSWTTGLTTGDRILVEANQKTYFATP